MNDKLIEYLLSKGDLGLLIAVLTIIGWVLFKNQNRMTQVVESNTASNVASAHALDKMATEIGSSVKQNSEFQRSVLESFSKSINHRK